MHGNSVSAIPRPQRSPGKHRLYAYAEIGALREALDHGLSVSSAISVAQESAISDVPALVGALTSFKRARADRAMEVALAMGSIEKAVEELLLPSLDEILLRRGTLSAVWEFSVSWSSDWLRRAQRLVAAPELHGTVLIGQGTRGPADPDTPRVRALELFCERAGLESLSLSVLAVVSLHEVIAALRPDVLVIAGSAAEDHEVARWAYGVRSLVSEPPIALFRRSCRTSLSPAKSIPLTSSPRAAQRELSAMLEQRRNPGEAEPGLPIAKPLTQRARGHALNGANREEPV